ncbi:BtrH N-terminal domain-containing protein [Streptomyces sp. enrichment culture]|uniref:BtrH N-terminal domain-containing protein n=1 Tax=Streptomyces sp. enrichment culture TaxID=1795815 RepID=UPI003F55FE69
MTQAPLFTDSSCYHAAFAALLHAAEPHADPFLVLGNNAATAARLADDGLLRFSDPLEPLTSTFARHGYALHRHPVTTPEEWQGALEALRCGTAIAVAADAFHLPHYWVGHRTSHALHVVVLQDYDETSGTVRLLDPGEVVFFDERVPAEQLTPAMCEGQAGQAWMRLVAHPDREPARPDAGSLLDLSRALSGTGTDKGTGTGTAWLSGTGLVQALHDDLDTYLDAVGNRPRGADGTQQDWGLGPWLLLGLWWYHHTLRWLAGHLGTLAADGTLAGRADLVEAVDRASRDLLVVRNLMMRLGVMPADDKRSATFRGQLRPRLGLALENLNTAGTSLATLAEETR